MYAALYMGTLCLVLLGLDKYATIKGWARKLGDRIECWVYYVRQVLGV